MMWRKFTKILQTTMQDNRFRVGIHVKIWYTSTTTFETVLR